MGKRLPARGANCFWFALSLLVCFHLAVGCGGRKRPPSAGSGGNGQPGSDRVPSSRPTVPGAPLLVRIGLVVSEPRVVIQAPGPCLLQEGRTRREVARLDKPGEVTIRNAEAGLRWSAAGQRGDAQSLVVQPLDPRDLLRWRSTPYRGEILLIPASGGVTVVNLVELESYLQGVVVWEIGHHGPEERAAIEAQAVAARTYTISHLGEREGHGFDLWSDVQDQVYKGAGDEDTLCNRAIAQTAGSVMYFDDEEIAAYYCSTCGGVTSDVSEVWPREAMPYLCSQLDSERGGKPFCADSPRFAWQEVWSAAALNRILARTLPEYLTYMSMPRRADWAGTLFTPRDHGMDSRQPGALRSMRVVRRTTSGRIARLDITTEAGTYHVRGDRVRWVLPPVSGFPAILWSALFEMEVTQDEAGRPQQVTARGKGFGHGVGMCQHGALGMARRGFDSGQILAHYYPGARLGTYDQQ